MRLASDGRTEDATAEASLVGPVVETFGIDFAASEAIAVVGWVTKSNIISACACNLDVEASTKLGGGSGDEDCAIVSS